MAAGFDVDCLPELLELLERTARAGRTVDVELRGAAGAFTGGAAAFRDALADSTVRCKMGG